MTIPKLTPYTGEVANPDGSQTQSEFTQNMFDQLSYEAQLATQLDATIDGMNNAVDEVEANATSAENSANAAEAAASSAGYKGLWPDTGGSAEKGDTYQTQVGGVPTGDYFTALQNTIVDPVGDNVNWKRNGDINRDNISDYTSIVFKASGGNSAVYNMVNGIPVAASVGDICTTGSTSWIRESLVSGDISDFKPVGDICVNDWGELGVSDDTSLFFEAISIGNQYKLKVTASGDANIGASDNPISIETNIDFSGLKIKCNTTDPKQNFARTFTIFEVKQDYVDITSSVTQSEFVKDSLYVPSLSDYDGFISINTSDVALWRDGNVASPQYKRAALVSSSGRIHQKLFFDFTASAGFSVLHKENLDQLTIEFGGFDFSDPSCYILTPITVSRNNVKLSGLNANVGSNNLCVYDGASIKDCHNVEIDGISYSNLGGKVNTELAYLIEMTMCSGIRCSRVYMRDGWSGINGNYFNDFYMSEFEVFSFGCHSFCSDIRVENGSYYRESQIQGYGYFDVINCKHICDPNNAQTTINSVLVRSDYGGAWDGDVNITNLKIVGSLTTTKIRAFYNQLPFINDSSYVPNVTLAMPNVNINKLNIEFCADALCTAEIFNLGEGQNNSEYIYTRYMPAKLSARCVDVKNTNSNQDGVVLLPYTNSLTMENSSVTTRDKVLKVVLDDLKYKPRGTDVNKFSDAMYNIIPLPTRDEHDFWQDIKVSNSDYTGVDTRTYRRLRVKIENSLTFSVRKVNRFGYGDDVSIPSSNETKIEFINCGVMGIYPSQAAGVVDILEFYDVSFGWRTKSPYQTAATTTDSIVFPGADNLIAVISRCRIDKPLDAFQTIGTQTFWDRVISSTGYTSTNSYIGYEGSSEVPPI